MNFTLITGRVATPPRFRGRGRVARTTFDVTVQFAGRSQTIHVRAMNDVARRARRLQLGDPVAIAGHLQSEPFDMPDRSVWHRIEIVPHEIDHHVIPAVARLLEVEP